MKKRQFIYLNKRVRHYRLFYLIALGLELKKKNIELHVATTESTSDRNVQTLVDAGVKVHLVEKIVLRENEGFAGTPVNMYFSFSVLRLLISLRPQYVMSEGVAGLLVSAIPYLLLWRPKVLVSYERTIFTERLSGRLRRLYFWVFDKLFRPSYIVNGNATRKLLLSRSIAESRIRWPNISVSPMFSSNYQPCNKALRSESTISLIWVANLTKRKNTPVLIEILENWDRFSDRFSLNIIGEGEYSADIKMAASDKAGVRVFGQVDPEHVADWMEKSDILLLPTLEDNWSLVALEASSKKCLVVTTPYNGITDDFQNFRDLLCVLPEDFCALLSNFPNDRRWLTEMQLNAYETASTYSIERCVMSVISSMNLMELK